MTDTRKPVVSTRLFYKDGSSDKEYHAAIHEMEAGCTVTFAFGRRGTALTSGTKTSSPVTREKAQLIYDKLVAEKTGKGYTQGGTGALFAGTGNAGRVSGLHPQLLNSIGAEAAAQYLADDAWCMQEKFDGRRILAAVTGGGAEGSNRSGLFVSLPQEISNALASLPDCVLDGELLGGSYVVFDLLALGSENLRERPYSERYARLTGAVPNAPVLRVADAAWDNAAKQALYDKIAAAGGEGVVFKRSDSKSAAGRPASGGGQVKCKFYATCTCVVSTQNDQRSVRLHLLDDGAAAVNVGSVTIPSSKAVPAPGALVEIRYLYAYKGGSLYQPAYLGERDDLDTSACGLGQLKYKAAEED